MRPLLLSLLITAIAIPVAACGDDEDSGGGGGGSAGGGYSRSTDTEKTDTREKSAGGGKPQTLRISADPGGALAFDKSSLTAKAGRVTIVMDNPSDLPHAVEIEGQGVEVAGETVMKGGVSRASARVEPGEYAYYCPVGNHGDAGMTGTLTVN